MPRVAGERCEILRPAVKRRLVKGLDSLESVFNAARGSLERGNEAEFLAHLSRARTLINDISSYSMKVVVEDCILWCKREDRADMIVRGVASMF